MFQSPNPPKIFQQQINKFIKLNLQHFHTILFIINSQHIKTMHRRTQQQSSFHTVKNPISNKISLKNTRPPVPLYNQSSQTQIFPTQSFHYTQQNFNNMNNHATQKSTTCQSIYGGSNKQSIKDLLVAARSRNHHSQNYISMTYQDIKVVIQQKQTNFLTNFLCGLKGNTQQVGCKCGKGGSCPWMDHWLSLSMKNMLYQPPVFYAVSKQSQQQIKKDIKRTQPTSKTFQILQYQQTLYQCLITYASIDPQIGYIQGMNILCSILLYHNFNINQCLQVFKYLMKSCGFRQIYLSQFQHAHKLTINLLQTLRFRCSDLYRHIVQKNNVNLNIFIIGWLLPMMGNLIPLQYMHMVVNCFIQRSWDGILKIILSLLLYLRPTILHIHDQTQLMELLSIQGLKNKILPWEQIIMSSNNLKIANFLSA